MIRVYALGPAFDDGWARRWWTMSDRAGNRVCLAAWPDGAGRDGTAGE